MKITIDLPPKILQPNRSKGMHWRPINAARKKYRSAAMLTVLAHDWAKGSVKFKCATVAVAFFVKDRRGLKQDADNAIASLKSAFDGLADAKLVGNDRDLIPLPPTFAVDKEHPRVELTIEEATTKE